MELFYKVSGVISVLLLATALLIAIIKYGAFEKNEKWYVYYIIFIFFIEVNSYIIIPSLRIKSNAFLYPVYIAGEFFTVTGIFIKKLKLNRYYFLIALLLSLFFLTGDKVFLKYEYNNDYSKGISNIIMISLIGYSLIQDIKNMKHKNQFQLIDKIFFLYFTVSIFIFLLQHQLIEFPSEYFSTIWVINNLMVCILYSLFIKTFLKLKK